MSNSIDSRLLLAPCFALAIGLAGLARAHTQAAAHDHAHGKDCGHKQVQHGGHVDYLHDGHYHAAHDGHFDEHGMPLPGKGDDTDRGVADAASHDIHKDHPHVHAANCGHKAVEHDGHTDYEHDGHYHAGHGDHVDDHGQIS
jgi:hypothetical protein